MPQQRKIAASTSKSLPSKTTSKRSYKSPAIRKEQKLGKVTGTLKVTGPPQ